MARKIVKIEMCNGCPECIGCGRDRRTELAVELYCDRCGDHVDEAYVVDGMDICEECITEHLETVREQDLEVEDYI